MIAKRPVAVPAIAMLAVAAACTADPRTAETPGGETIRVGVVAEGLVHPWGLVFLPDERMLVTERPGRLRIVTKDGQVSPPVDGVPPVFAMGQGGLLDVQLAPDYEQSSQVYLSYAEPGPGGACTAVARGTLDTEALVLENVEVIFRQQPKVSGENHFGGRLVFTEDDKLFITTGERFKFEPAQDLSNHLGTIIRVNPDGTTPEDNPFAGPAAERTRDAQSAIWSYGHRNIEAAAIHPDTGELWVAEMGPQGGDELNRIEPGANYGWPVVSWGEHYDGTDIPDPPTRPEFADAVHQWTPVISPSGMVYYTGGLFPEWQGQFLIGGLSSQALIRVALDGREVAQTRQMDMGARIREVEQAPDGSIVLLTDEENGKILRLTPQ